MHIITTGRAQIAGRLIAPGTVLDLPEAEALPAIEAGTAVPWPPQPAELESGDGDSVGEGEATGEGSGSEEGGEGA